MLIMKLGHEEEASPPRRGDFYENASYDDGYSPSPPRASGGAYFPQTNTFPPPPPPAAGFTQTNTSTTHINDYPAHPYNPADYVDSPPINDPYHPPRVRGREGDNVSSTIPPTSTPSPLPPSYHSEREIYTPSDPPNPQPQNTLSAVYPEGALLPLRTC